MADMSDAEMRAEGDKLLATVLPSEMGSAFGAIHEMFLTLKAGGFTEFQSLWLIGYVISSGAKPSEE